MMERNNNNSICTLYFYGRDKYGHDNKIPILIGNIKVIDEYVAYCENYTMLFHFLPDAAKELIENNFCYGIDIGNNESMSKHFKLFKVGTNGGGRLIFKSDEDVLYCDFNDVIRIAKQLVMSESQYNVSRLKINSAQIELIKYNFFKKLYETYVKGTSLIKTLELHGDDESKIHSIATSFENIKIIIYNAWQQNHPKRNLAWTLKDTLTNLNNVGGNFPKTLAFSDEIVRRFDNRTIDVTKIKKEIIDNVLNFWRTYINEYEISMEDQKLSELNLRLEKLREQLSKENLSSEKKDAINNQIVYLASQRDGILYRDSLRGQLLSNNSDEEEYAILEELMGLSDLDPYPSKFSKKS